MVPRMPSLWTDDLDQVWCVAMSRLGLQNIVRASAAGRVLQLPAAPAHESCDDSFSDGGGSIDNFCIGSRDTVQYADAEEADCSEASSLSTNDSRDSEDEPVDPLVADAVHKLCAWARRSNMPRTRERC